MKNNEYIEFFVEDTGIGIESHMQSAIFQRFRQVDESMSRNFGGTGLGLAICNGLSKILGGKLWLKSEPGKGSTFFFEIPYQHTDTTIKKSPVKIILDEIYDWSGKTILIVEDDPINQEFLNAILEPTKATLINSYSGEDSIKLCIEHPEINIVLMDIRLPQMNGFEAFEKIHQMRSDLPVIAQTAFELQKMLIML